MPVKSQDPLWVRLLPEFLRAHIAGRVNLQAIANNSGWLIFEKVVRAVFGLLVGAWMVRYLGPVQFGQIAYVLAILAFFQAAANLGLDSIVVRDISLRNEQAGQILGTTFALRLCCGFFAWLLAITAMGLMNGWNNDGVLLIALAGGMLVFQASETVDLWFQSQSQSKRTVVIKLAAFLISSGIKVALIMLQAPLWLFAATMTFEGLLVAVGLAFAYKSFPSNRRWETFAGLGRRLLRESWPFALSGLLIMVYVRIDQIMIKEMLGERELGLYAAILPLSSFWQVVPMTLAVSLAPYIAKQREVGEVDYRKSLVLVFRFFFYLGVLVSLGTFAISGWLVPLLFGSSYAEAVRVLDIHAISNVFCFMGIAHGLWLVNERRFAVRLYGTAIAGISVIAVNLYALPSIGLVGASLAAILAQAIAAFFVNALLDRTSFKLQLEAIIFRKI